MKIDENIALDNRKRHKIKTKIRFDKKSAIKRREISVENKRKNNALIKKYADRISVFARRFSKVKLCIYGNNGQKALIAISKICTVWGVEKREDCVCFWVDGKHLSKIIALLKNLCYDYKIANIGGVLPKVSSLLGRVGIALGSVVFALTLAMYAMHVASVDISFIGKESLSVKSDVQSLLDTYGVRKGVRFDSLDIDTLQGEISSLKDVAYASCTKEGNRIVILLKSSLGDEYVLDIDGSAVKAQKRAVVTKVVVEGGTAIKKYGDVVSVGDVVIDGYVEMGEDRISVEAKGYAYGIVYYETSRFFPTEEVVTSYGETKRMSRLSMFGKVPGIPQSPYERYTLKTSVEDFGFLLPIKIYTYEFCEIVESNNTCVLDVEDMKKEVYSSLLCEIDTTAKIRDVHYSIATSQNGTQVQALMEVEERIT